MDDIYNDLENFNDVNIVEELKNENKVLKFKLEEYSSAMHKLQKDFDKLSVEYKNLEKNYSSLLKTARSEIERKTEAIKKLNLEKDTLVLNSLKKAKNILHNRRSNLKDTQSKKPKEDINSCRNEVKNTIKGSTKRSDNQLQVNRQPSVETVSSIPTDRQSTHSENKISKIRLDNKIPKEGCVTGRDERDKAYTKDNLQERPRVMKVMNRRKSMPSFGSDEDSRKSNLEPQQTQSPEEVRHFERHYVTQDYVEPETFDYYQAPSSSYQKRGKRYNDFERQRNYESSDQSRRYFSPDNQHHRYGKDFPENYNQRDHRDKRRVEKSPPSDRYKRSKSRDRRQNFERENYRDTGRYFYHNNDHLPAKSKSKFELEEPSRKRPKIDSYSRQPSDKNFNKEKERGLPEKYSFTKPKEPLEPFLNQSPEFTVNSNVLHHSVKETRPTATISLPELTNNKCILNIDNQTSTLAKAFGGSVDKTPICQPTWVEDKQKSLDKFNPKAVDLMSEIYVDIENFEKSNSLESGEIRSLDEDVSNVTNESNILDQTEDTVKSSDHKSNQIPPHLSATKGVDKTLTTKYKIPHLKKNVTKESSNTQQHLPKKLQTFAKDFKVVVEGKHLTAKCSDNYIDNANPIHTKKPESVLKKLMNEKKCSENDNRKKLRSSDKVVDISTIAGDLELSNETNDNIDVVKEDTSPDMKIKNKVPEQLPKKEKHTSSEKLKDRANKSDDKGKKSKDIKKSSNSKKENVKEKTRDCVGTGASSKKRKNKTKMDDEKVNIIKEKIPLQTTKGKEKDDKQTTLDQRKTKFSDLFGDSNSLITPDDLGLTNVTPDKYVSVDDNTQDAIDLSIEDITMVRVRKSADNTHVEENFLQQIPYETATTDATATNSENPNINGNENCQSNKSTTLMYENAISETNLSNIVKTVIISTGVQPQHILKNVNDVSSNINEEKSLKKNALNNIKPPTPNKLINSKESETNMESTNTSNNVDKPNISTDTDNNLKTNTSDNNCESDIPDVRIFIRRRKKVMKKTTK